MCKLKIILKIQKTIQNSLKTPQRRNYIYIYIYIYIHITHTYIETYTYIYNIFIYTIYAIAVIFEIVRELAMGFSQALWSLRCRDVFRTQSGV